MSLTVLTWEQMRDVERLLAEARGVTLLESIDIAGRALAETARQLLTGRVAGKDIIVLAGNGQKGAVGLAATRHLHKADAQARIVLAGPTADLEEMAAHQYVLLREMGLEAWGLSMTKEQMAEQEPIHWTSAALIIDALLEPELTHDPTGEAADLIRMANATRRPILAFNAPSGVSGDEGYILSPCMDAVATMTLALPKYALLEAWPVVGELWVADLGVPTDLYESIGLEVADIFNGKPVISLGSARKLAQSL